MEPEPTVPRHEMLSTFNAMDDFERELQDGRRRGLSLLVYHKNYDHYCSGTDACRIIFLVRRGHFELSNL